MRFTQTKLIRMMAGPAATRTEHDKRRAAFAGSFANPGIGTVLFDGLDSGPWTEVDIRAHQAHLPGDIERHAGYLRMIAGYDHEPPLALYLAEAIARAPSTAEANLGATPVWCISWQTGMPTDRRQFYVDVDLAVPGQVGATNGQVFFHFNSEAELVGAVLQLPLLRDDDPTLTSDQLPERKLSTELAVALFNVVVAVQAERQLDIWERVREQIADQLPDLPPA